MDFASVISHPELRNLYFHWLKHVPDQKLARFSPDKFTRFLPNIFLMDFDESRHRFRYRLIGTYIQEKVGMNITGLYLDEFRTGQAHANIHELFERCITENIVGYHVSKLSTETDQYATYYRLVMPMTDDDGQPQRILGGWYCEYNGALKGSIMEFESLGARFDRLELVFREDKGGPAS